MRGLFSQFEASLVLAVVATVAAIAAAAVVGTRLRRSGGAWVTASARVLAVGAVIVTVVATALPRSAGFETGGDLVLRPGRGGLGNLDQILDDPNSLAGVLLLANIVLYIAVGLLATIGWYERRRVVLLGCLGLSLFVETSQYLFLGRVAATDDVILNMAGAVIGWGAALLAVGMGLARTKPSTG